MTKLEKSLKRELRVGQQLYALTIGVADGTIDKTMTSACLYRLGAR